MEKILPIFSEENIVTFYNFEDQNFYTQTYKEKSKVTGIIQLIISLCGGVALFYFTNFKLEQVNIFLIEVVVFVLGVFCGFLYFLWTRSFYKKHEFKPVHFTSEDWPQLKAKTEQNLKQYKFFLHLMYAMALLSYLSAIAYPILICIILAFFCTTFSVFYFLYVDVKNKEKLIARLSE